MSSATLSPFAGAIRGTAFWLAVALPPAHLLVLSAAPLTLADLTLLAGLICGHVAALVVGHGYAAGR